MNQALKDQRVQELISLYNNGDIKECLLRAKKVAKIYPEEPFVFNLIGVVSASIGSYEEAIESYKRALKINPNYFEVYNNLGVALNDSKKPKDAISYLRKALKINPHYPEAYNNLGNALKEIEKLDQAIESYENAIKLNPKFIDPYTNLAIVFVSKKNENEKAEYYFKKALEISPENIQNTLTFANHLYHQKLFERSKELLFSIIKQNPYHSESLNRLGLCHLEQENYNAALSNFERALEINPNQIEPLNNKGLTFYKKNDFKRAKEVFLKVLSLDSEYIEAINNLGRVYTAMGLPDNAIEILSSKLKSNADNPKLLSCLVDAYARQQSYIEALNCCKKVIDLEGETASALNSLGHLYHKIGDYEKAEINFKKAFKLDKNFSRALVNLSILKHDNGYYLEAEELMNSILAKEPDRKDVKNNLGYLYLTLGKFKEGWEKYEYRWKVDPGDKVVWPLKDKPLWDGKSASGVLLWREQGIGDDIIFLGLVPEAYEKAGKDMTVLIDPRLVAMCKRSMPGIEFLPAVKGSVQEDRFDYHLPMGSLPRLFRSSEEDFSKTRESYLKADMERVEVLRKELGVEGKKVIGISWKSFKSLNTTKKSMDLEQFGRMFDGLDVVLLNLQYGDVNEEIRAFTKGTGIEVLQCSSVNLKEDLDGLGALIALCDLVVSTSNVTIHMAGALGKEAWVLLPFAANFWWLIERTDSLWYPTVKLYRQKSLQDWSEILKNIEAQLKIEHINRFLN